MTTDQAIRRSTLLFVTFSLAALAASACGGDPRPEDLEAELAAAKGDSSGLDLLQLSPETITGTDIESYVARAILRHGLPGNCELVDFRAYNSSTENGGLKLGYLRLMLQSYDIDDKDKLYLMDSPYSRFEDVTEEAELSDDIRHFRYHEGDRFQYMQLEVKVDVVAGEVVELHGETAFGFKYNESSCVKPPLQE